MAQTPFSLLLLKRLCLSSQNPRPPLPPFSILLSHLLLKPFSTSQASTTPSVSSPSDPKTSSLSARMSFIFDQIDAIEKERSQKDQTLQRIRAWRESKKSESLPVETRKEESVSEAVDDGRSENTAESELKLEATKQKKEVELVHPWPEWIELMERLVQQNYFDHRRKDEDRMVLELGFDASGIAAEDHVDFDFKDFRTVQTACLNFGKDRFDILRPLSKKDIQILVGFGCPSADKKVVFSAKLLRKLVHLDEGDVCSSCSLRNSCDRAYLVTNKEDEARTIDIMRVLLTYGFDPMNGSVVNDSLLKKKSVKTVVRKLLHQVVKLSSVPIDPNLPPPIIKKPPPKVKQPPPPPKRRVGRDDIEMKKGDWLCPKCDFMNFAKNTVCLQCDAKRPKRQLLPGEWECPECNFLNYRRNMVCFHCECKRPHDEFMENKMEERQHIPRIGLRKVPSREEVANAWNFDFDDDESDGADVAAFEYADSSAMAQGGPPMDNQAGGNIRGAEGNFNKISKGRHERDFSDNNHRPGMGFDDFVDEESDIDSYELDTANNNSARRPSSIDFSDVEGKSGSEDFEGSDHNGFAHRKTGPLSYNKQSKKREAFSGSEDDELDFDLEDELPRNWKSSHVAASRPRNSGRVSAGRYGGLNNGSDEDPGLYSNDDSDLDANFGPRNSEGNKSSPAGRRDFHRKDDSDSDFDEDDRRFSKYNSGGNDRENDRRSNNSQARGNYKFTRGDDFRSNSVRGGRMNSSRGSRGAPIRRFEGNDRSEREGFSDRRFKGNDRGGQGMGVRGRRFEGKDHTERGGFSDRRFEGNDRGARGGDRKGVRGGRGGGYEKQQKGRYKGNGYDRGWDNDDGQFRNSRRVIER